MRQLITTISTLAILAFTVPAFAHFQMIYTPESALNKGGKIPLAIVFTPPL